MNHRIADIIRAGNPLRITGSGTWLDAGRPVESTTVVCTNDITGIVEYVPGDLVITVRAGTTLVEISQTTAEHNQWLPLEPYTRLGTGGADIGTIGATVATASHGPLALGYGRVRDQVLGLHGITGNGTTMRAGGRVVKNVAGFDMVRLVTGSWGTLGVITEISLRLHARPAVDETFALAIELPDSAVEYDAALATLVARLNRSPLLASTLSLSACVLLSPLAADAVRSGFDLPRASLVLLARATGNRTRVNALRTALSSLNALVDVDSRIWQHIRTVDIGNATIRIADAPMRSAHTVRHVLSWCSTANAIQPYIVIEPMRGAVRLSCTVNEHSASAVSLPSGAVAERLPANWWPMVPSSVEDHISSALQQTFDSTGILNRGILGTPSVVELKNTSAAGTATAVSTRSS